MANLGDFIGKGNDLSFKGTRKILFYVEIFIIIDAFVDYGLTI
jgi:hypothetical protein